MIKLYNGMTNRHALNQLHLLCNVISENKETLLSEFYKKGSVSFHTNLDFFGMPDEMSDICTLSNEKEIEDYIKNDTEVRLKKFIRSNHINLDTDYLLNDIIDFIKEKGYYPLDNEMKNIMKFAEDKRIKNSPVSPNTITKITTQDVMREILELAEEIMETRRETKPDDISIHTEPYPDRLSIPDDKFNPVITYERYYGSKDSSDYRLDIYLNAKYFYEISSVCFYRFKYDGEIYCDTEKWNRQKVDLPIKCLIKIHKNMVKLAQKEKIDFTPEITDYSKITASK
ncbi:MAG: hypothetical protein E7311_03505 [Clostridiales bacterium]|nr:hypothetical protein [Clostridiales bacterium]